MSSIQDNQTHQRNVTRHFVTRIVKRSLASSVDLSRPKRLYQKKHN